VDDQKILASQEDFGNVSVCPGGVVHVNLVHLSIKLLPSDFVKFCDLISQARRNFDAPPRSGGKPVLQVVSPRVPDDSGDEEDK
jgi:hypothetical protein